MNFLLHSIDVCVPVFCIWLEKKDEDEEEEEEENGIKYEDRKFIIGNTSDDLLIDRT